MQQIYQIQSPYQQQQQQQPLPVQHVVVLQIPMEDHPVHTTCPSCHATIQTTVTEETSANTHLLAGFLCMMCCIPCAIIPYFCSTTKNSVHTCPNCTAYIGTYNPFHRRRYNRW
ncbi:lipopolysaccharide-induced tumor necrosis factor-alpha factor homolog [Bradysia coprophila]|uniref:lipopolysaccharide-induced tumor necrosis factor-alpha factor homolog n=1 Tax=Bradysia coprophila TaxID=38358 RepID=UPI00187DD91A|nr:lipopolysaccharide-induced tumor necrosis factor-alpha factor homolog [Bradysia coprophila]